MNNRFALKIGATPVKGGVNFRVWAPEADSVEVEIVENGGVKTPLHRQGEYFEGVVNATAGDHYWYWLNGKLRRPDPASRSQPDGVHGASQILDQHFTWSDKQWRGMPLEKYLIYELHVGTFSKEGTFDGVISRLEYLLELGVTAVELMPVAQFPGDRNWGYDGTFPFAPQNSYGGSDGLKRLVDACHSCGLAVILDVVYNHLGPEGNYLHAFGPYFTDRYRTPWGDAVNFDDSGSDVVRSYFISNAVHWIAEYHIDALRLDAIHGIYDFGALHILEELTKAVHSKGVELGRKVYVIAESDLNDVRVISAPQIGGYGLDAQWNDDFHHALRSLLTGDQAGYYSDFGKFSDFVKSVTEGFVVSGCYSAFRKRRHGSSSLEIPPGQLVVFSQNHDQVGNRIRGERLGNYLTKERLKLAAAAVLLSPYIPMLFMGEEYAESAPFPYFVSHSDSELVDGVRRGRLEEFAAFADQGVPPDPQDEATFLSAKLDQEQRRSGEHRAVFEFYRELIQLRKECEPLARPSRANMQVLGMEEERMLAIIRNIADEQLFCLFNFSDRDCIIPPSLAGGNIRIMLDSTGRYPAGSCMTVYSTRPATFPTLAPFGVIVYRTERNN
ncbi:MAG: malto-oligosyltrehalose trehalohydrolase [Desulfuromonadaceae bacterium]|nr:malto-oligosyltrehalose trehalohydrolase [Desulfuromonadaceae bacterium]MDD2855712.1 malto-oligosyltrehalose trehalohydrolase [Desulfuromonadaceae bacterium]